MFDRYAPEMELVKHSIDFSQRDVEGAVEVSLYKVPPVSPWEGFLSRVEA